MKLWILIRTSCVNLGAAVALALLAVLFTGCQIEQYSHLVPQNIFVYPNSNVTPLQPVKAKAEGGGGFIPPALDSKAEVALYNQALSQVNGANLIIDYIMTYKVYSFPGLPFYWSNVELEGTAAKMEVGKQILK